MSETVTPEQIMHQRIDDYRAAARGDLVIRSWAYSDTGEVCKEVVSSPEVEVDFFDPVQDYERVLGIPITYQGIMPPEKAVALADKLEAALSQA